MYLLLTFVKLFSVSFIQLELTPSHFFTLKYLNLNARMTVDKIPHHFVDGLIFQKKKNKVVDFP